MDTGYKRSSMVEISWKSFVFILCLATKVVHASEDPTQTFGVSCLRIEEDMCSKLEKSITKSITPEEALSKIKEGKPIVETLIKGRLDLKPLTNKKDMVDSKVIITNSIIEGDLIADGITFNEGFSLAETCVIGDASFKSMRKEGVVGEDPTISTSFNRKADFYETVFSKKVIFYKANFKEKAKFRCAKFKGEASFNEVDFRTPEERVHFRGAVFKDIAKFERSDFQGVASFQETEFKRDVTFRGASFSKMVDFRDAVFSKDINLNGAIYPHILVTWEQIEGRISPEKLTKNNSKEYEESAKTLVYLRNRFYSEGSLKDGNDAHFEYRKRQRKLLPYGCEWAIDFVRYLILGYGTRALMPFCFGMGMILLLVSLFKWEGKNIKESILFGFWVFLGIGEHKECFESHPWIATIGRLFGWISMAIFLLILTKSLS